MDRPVVNPVEPEAELRLWAAPRMVVVTQFAGGVVFLLLALTNLMGSDPSAWERFLGVLAAVVGGVALGVGGSLSVHARMVRRHMEVWHAEAAAPATSASGPPART